jgi:hypothetical protein
LWLRRSRVRVPSVTPSFAGKTYPPAGWQGAFDSNLTLTRRPRRGYARTTSAEPSPRRAYRVGLPLHRLRGARRREEFHARRLRRRGGHNYRDRSGGRGRVPGRSGTLNKGSSRDFLVVDAYPRGQSWNLRTREPGERPRSSRTSATCLCPRRTPPSGTKDRCSNAGRTNFLIGL